MAWLKKKQLRDANEVAIIGMSCCFPDAENYQQYWQNLTNGLNSIREIPPDRWDISQYYSPDIHSPNKSVSKWGGMLRDIAGFDTSFFNISPSEAQSMDPQQRLLLQEAWHCLEDAGILLGVLQQNRTAVYVGAMAIDYHHLVAMANEIDSYACLGNYQGILASRLSYFMQLKGESKTLDTACSSSLVALHDAKRGLIEGECDYAFAAGVSVICHPAKYISFSKLRMLSPEGQCKTFDKAANGYVPGEGVGILLLTTLENALKRGHRIHGIVKGSAVNHTGKSHSITAPRVEAQCEVIIATQKEASIHPECITYIEAHGTGTSLGDPIEVEALTQAFFSQTDKKQYCGLGSVKTNIGHLEAAAGIAGVIKVLLMMQQQKFVPTLNVKEVNPLINLQNSPFYLTQEVADWRVSTQNKRCAGVSSFGFGGVNAHVILEEYPTQDQIFEKQSTYPFILSAKSSESLQALIKMWQSHVHTTNFEQQSLNDISYTLLRGREMLPYRLGLSVSSSTDLCKQLNFVDTSSQNFVTHKIFWIDSTFDATYQEFVLLSSLHPPLQKHYEFCCQILITLKQKKLIKEWQKETVTQTAQTIFLAIVLYCCSNYLLSLGSKPFFISGYGTGRIIAAAVSGYLSLSQALQILLLRNKKNKKTKALILHLKTPKFPFYDVNLQKIFSPLQIDAISCQQLRKHIFVDGLLLKDLKSQIELLRENQFTLKEYLQTWDQALKATLDLTLDELWVKPQNKKDDLSTDYALLLQIILLTSLKKLQQKWQLNDRINMPSLELNAFTDLLVMNELSKELILRWLVSNNLNDCTQLAKALQSIQHQEIYSPLLAKLFLPFSPASIDASIWLSTPEDIQGNLEVFLSKFSLEQQQIFVLGANKESAFQCRLNTLKEFSTWLLKLWTHHGLNTELIDAYHFKGQFISLPLYPFVKKRYWCDRTIQNPANAMKLKLKSPAGDLVSLPQTVSSPESIIQPTSGSFAPLKIPALSTYPSGLEEKITSQLEKLLNQQLYLEDGTLILDQPLSVYGLDSILAVELIKQINITFGLDLKATTFYNYPTLKTLSAYIATLWVEKTPSVIEAIDSDVRSPVVRVELKQKEHTVGVCSEAIAVVGISGYLPQAKTLAEYWELLKTGHDAVTEIPANRWSIEDYYHTDPQQSEKTQSKWGGFIEGVDEFDPLFFNISPSEAEWMDPQQRLFLEVSWQALEDAGYSQERLDGSRCGVYVGVMNNDYQELMQKTSALPTAHQMLGNSHSILAAG